MQCMLAGTHQLSAVQEVQPRANCSHCDLSPTYTLTASNSCGQKAGLPAKQLSPYRYSAAVTHRMHGTTVYEKTRTGPIPQSSVPKVLGGSCLTLNSWCIPPVLGAHGTSGLLKLTTAFKTALKTYLFKSCLS